MLNRLLLSLLFVPAVACGGGDTPTPTPIDTAPPTPDSPPVALACPPTGLMGSVGTAAKPVGVPAQGCTPGGAPPNGCAACGADGNTPCDWYPDPPTEGTNTGIAEFQFITGIAETMDQLQFKVATPIVTGSAIPWRTDITLETSYAAFSIYLQSQNGSDVDRVMFPTSGSITVTESVPAQGGKTTATISATSYAELDENGAVLAGGCVTDLNSLSLFLQQGSATFQKPNTPDDGSGRPWVKILPYDQATFGKIVPR